MERKEEKQTGALDTGSIHKIVPERCRLGEPLPWKPEIRRAWPSSRYQRHSGEQVPQACSSERNYYGQRKKPTEKKKFTSGEYTAAWVILEMKWSNWESSCSSGICWIFWKKYCKIFRGKLSVTSARTPSTPCTTDTCWLCYLVKIYETKCQILVIKLSLKGEVRTSW